MTIYDDIYGTTATSTVLRLLNAVSYEKKRFMRLNV